MDELVPAPLAPLACGYSTTGASDITPVVRQVPRFLEMGVLTTEDTVIATSKWDPVNSATDVPFNSKSYLHSGLQSSGSCNNRVSLRLARSQSNRLKRVTSTSARNK